MDEELLQTQERMMGESEGQRGRVAWRNGGVPVGAVTLLLHNIGGLDVSRDDTST